MAVTPWPWTLNLWPWKVFSIAHSHDEYLTNFHWNSSTIRAKITRHVKYVLTGRRQTAGRKIIFIPQPENSIWPRYDLDRWPLILKTWPAISIHMIIICGKFHWNSSINYRDIASRGIAVSGQQTDTGRTDDPKKWCSQPTVVSGEHKKCNDLWWCSKVVAQSVDLRNSVREFPTKGPNKNCVSTVICSQFEGWLKIYEGTAL